MADSIRYIRDSVHDYGTGQTGILVARFDSLQPLRGSNRYNGLDAGVWNWIGTDCKISASLILYYLYWDQLHHIFVGKAMRKKNKQKVEVKKIRCWGQNAFDPLIRQRQIINLSSSFAGIHQ